MDEQYWERMVARLECEALDSDTMVGPLLRNDKAIAILKQIAADQVERDIEAMKDVGTNYCNIACTDCGFWNGHDCIVARHYIAAIRSAGGTDEKS